MEAVLPAHCVGCGVTGTYLCSACVGSMESAVPMTAASQAFSFDSMTSAFVYTGVARTAVHRLKFGGLRALAPLMAPAMAGTVRYGSPAEVVVPVPLHRSRLKERGYNQAQLLADRVAVALGVPLDTRLLSRVRQAGTQVDAGSATVRQANVRGAFEATRQALGLRVLLVDDVTTTGSTLDAAAGALKEAGAAAVHCVTFAKEL